MDHKQMRQRNSTIELLRIVSVLMIIGLHYLNRNIGGALNTDNTINQAIGHFLESVCIISVNVMVLITGFYSVESKKLRILKLVELYFILVFYNLFFYFIGFAVGNYSFSIIEMGFAVFPFLRGGDWFIETYIILMLFSPFVNILLRALNQQQYRVLLLIQLVIFSGWESFLPSPPIIDGGYGIIHFVTLYMIGAYIKRFNKYSVFKAGSTIGVLLCSVFLVFICSFIPFVKTRAWDYCFILNIVSATCLFSLFLNMPETYNKIINRISSASFGIIILHAIPYIQKNIYTDIMNVPQMANSKVFLLHFLLCISVQFIICMCIDFLRQSIWSFSMKRLIYNNILLNIEDKINRLLENDRIS